MQLQIIDALCRRVTLLLLVLTSLAGLLIAIARAETPRRNIGRDEQISFNIPSQSLADALYAFTAVTGVEALASSALLANRRSADLRGALTIERALQTLLSGTGLAVRFVDSGSFTLTPAQTPSAADDALSDVPRYVSYSALLQNAVKRALCRQSDTRPGDYRTAIQIWIAPSGIVARTNLVGTTGDAARDKMLSDLFIMLPIGAAPPIGLPQPATLLILPRTQIADCASPERASGP